MRRLMLVALFLSGTSLAQDLPPNGGPPLDRPGPHRPDGKAHFLFLSPMGEPFRTEDPDHAWFVGADTNRDGRIDRAEFRADAARFFKVLDRGGDGEIDPDDIDHYENMMVPEIRVPDGPGRSGGERSSGSRRGPQGGGRGGGPRGGGPDGDGPGGRGQPDGGSDSSFGQRGSGKGSQKADMLGRQGAGLYSYLDFPEPITSADTNFNRGIDMAEFERAADQRFALLDRNGDGAIARDELPRINTRVRGGGPGGRPSGPPPGQRPDRQAGNEGDGE